jgi:hypothetical protein
MTADWPARLAEMAAVAAVRRTARRELRGRLAAARDAGLRARHQAKLDEAAGTGAGSSRARIERRPSASVSAALPPDSPCPGHTEGVGRG